MNDRITSFKLNWYDCGLCCADDMVQEEIIIHRNDNLLVFKELNGYGVTCSCELIHIESKATEEFSLFCRTLLENGNPIIESKSVMAANGKFVCGTAPTRSRRYAGLWSIHRMERKLSSTYALS